MPSSSLYFGVYEYMKRRLSPLLLPPQTAQGTADKKGTPQQVTPHRIVCSLVRPAIFF
jgi:hypothetical protein